MEIETQRKALGALKISLSTAMGLALIKFFVGWLTQSMAIIASALDSLMDAGSSIVNLLAVREAAKPPDEDHTYGHGKIEALAGLIQSLFVTVSGLFVISESVKRLIVGSTVKTIPVGIGVMLVSMLASYLIVWVIQRASREVRSLVLAAERLHYATDILTNGGVILALVLVQTTGFAVWDLLVSIAVSIYIFKSSFGILRNSLDELLDKSLPQTAVRKIEYLIQSHHPSIIGLHNFRSRRVGEKIFLDFHIEIRGEDDFKSAHLMTEGLIAAIKSSYPHADVTVHYDPEGAD